MIGPVFDDMCSGCLLFFGRISHSCEISRIGWRPEEQTDWAIMEFRAVEVHPTWFLA